LQGQGYQGFGGFDSTIFEDFGDILGNFFGFNFQNSLAVKVRPGQESSPAGIWLLKSELAWKKQPPE
jgi:DnaJ-class molecular chaperone